MDIKKLKDSHIDYDMGLYRFMNNISLYEGLLREFAKSNEYAFAKNAYERQDYNAMFRYLHSMKGATGNLGMNTLYNLTTELAEVLLHEEYSKIEPLYSLVQQEYQLVINGIKAAVD